MCGRYHFSDDTDIEEIEKILEEINNKYKDTGLSAKTGEVYPTNNVPILALSSGKPEISLMTWGFPQWNGKGVTINARSETAAEKRMFSKPLRERRCVIPSTGFYEWSHGSNGKPKDKFMFRTDGDPMLYMAGLYTPFTDASQETALNGTALKETSLNKTALNKTALKERFVILTQNANPYISDIHDRMPVVLKKDELVRWLTDYSFAAEMMSRESITLIREPV